MGWLRMVVIEELGFKEEEIDAIMSRFLCSLDQDDWESIKFVDDNEEEGENFFKLPTGRMVYFPEELLYKDLLSQMD
ncbi:hypothetical protein FHR92_005160 [Fontibacillus solani]|uniref:Uncharacterized protein n=1 Tax=Fontibacillus solani TaxID=1572857 RepID=A0A7W3SYR2_9BACL|nr:hypothetical protein [Fontibacillus solani]MBA9088642.1 hypothetical protein [Fontibacillus solani]